MQNETLRDVLDWTSGFHADLHRCMIRCSEQTTDERAVLLLEYLATHEQKLAELISAFKDEASESALNTWCREHFEKEPAIRDMSDSKPIADMSTDEILEFVSNKHSQLIELYKSLMDKAPIADMKQLLTQLVDLEEHEIMSMMQGANQVGETY